MKNGVGRIKKSKSKLRCRRSEVEHIIKDLENWSKKFWEKLLVSEQGVRINRENDPYEKQ